MDDKSCCNISTQAILLFTIDARHWHKVPAVAGPSWACLTFEYSVGDRNSLNWKVDRF